MYPEISFRRSREVDREICLRRRSRLTVGVKGDGRRFLSKVIKPREEGAHVRAGEGIAVRAAARTDR